MGGAVATRLAAAGLALPAPAAAVGAYVPAVRAGHLVFTSGQLPTRDGELLAVGSVPGDLKPEHAAACAAQCALNALAAASTVCDLDAVVRVVKLVGYVASEPGYGGQPAVVNGASDVMRIAFGDVGAHVREAVGASALPLDAPVEVSLVLEVR